MANRYWVGGTGNWSDDDNHWATTSGGAPADGNLPTSADNVIFDSASNATAYTCTVNTGTNNCLDITIGGPASGKITFAGSAALNVYGSFNASGGAAGILYNYTGAVSFKATSTGKTITSNSIATWSNGTVFDGVGGGWTIQDAFTGSSGLTLTNGSLDTNGQTMTIGFSSSNSNVRSLTLGATNWVIGTNGWNISTSTNMTLSAGTSTISSTSGQPGFHGGGLTYNNLTFSALGTNGGTITGANTFNNLSITAAGNFGESGLLIVSADQIIIGTLTLAASIDNRRLLVRSDIPGTQRTLTAAAVTASRVDIQDMIGAGAGSWNLAAITGLSGDCGGNSGITFTTPATQTANGTTSFSWSNAARWTSRVPLPQDDVVINNAFGTSQTVTADMPRLGKSIDFTGATWTTALTWATAAATPTSIFGSLTLINGLTLSGISAHTFEGRGNFTLTSYSATFGKGITLNAATGTLTLGDDLTLGNTRRLTITSGTLTVGASNYIISTGTLTLNGGTLTLGSGTHLITGTGTTTWNVTSGTLTAFTGTVKITDTSNTAITFVGGDKTYNNIWFDRGASTGALTITGSNTFNDFKDTGTSAHSIKFTTGTTQTVTTFSVSGTVGNLISIDSTTTGTHSLVKSGGGTISCDYLNIQHSVATPANTWYAGTNSTNNQAVATAGSGWIFTNPPLNGGFLTFM